MLSCDRRDRAARIAGWTRTAQHHDARVADRPRKVGEIQRVVAGPEADLEGGRSEARKHRLVGGPGLYHPRLWHTADSAAAGQAECRDRRCRN
jgi:hypothetical protein